MQNKNKEFDKIIRYSLTTNGSLITDEIIQFLNKHKFSVELSFDGLAQDSQRKKGSSKKIVSCIKELLNFPDIDLEVNSVFTPETVDHISESIEFIMELGVLNIRLSLSIIKPWDQASLQRLEKEMIKISKIVLSHHERKGNIPVINFRDDLEKGIFSCAAGLDRLTITPEGKIWGCYLFPEYFEGKENSPEYQKFYFGTLDNFIENHENVYPRISSNYAQLSMDNFSTPKMNCFLCSELKNCVICPINAGFSGVSLGKIPQYACQIQKIKIRIRKKFQQEI